MHEVFRSIDLNGQILRHLCAPLGKKIFHDGGSSYGSFKALTYRTTRGGAIDCRSLDKIQSIIVRDCEKSRKMKEPKQYFKCRVVSKSRTKDGVPM